MKVHHSFFPFQFGYESVASPATTTRLNLHKGSRKEPEEAQTMCSAIHHDQQLEELLWLTANPWPSPASTTYQVLHLKFRDEFPPSHSKLKRKIRKWGNVILPFHNSSDDTIGFGGWVDQIDFDVGYGIKEDLLEYCQPRARIRMLH